jgi:hypothetical protein
MPPLPPSVSRSAPRPWPPRPQPPAWRDAKISAACSASLALGVASFADALIAAHRAALEMAWRQPDIAPKLLAIVELPVEDFADQCRSDLRSDALEPDEIPDLLRIGVHR